MCFRFSVVSIFALFQEPLVHRGGSNCTRPQRQTDVVENKAWGISEPEQLRIYKRAAPRQGRQTKKRQNSEYHRNMLRKVHPLIIPSYLYPIIYSYFILHLLQVMYEQLKGINNCGQTVPCAQTRVVRMNVRPITKRII